VFFSHRHSSLPRPRSADFRMSPLLRCSTRSLVAGRTDKCDDLEGAEVRINNDSDRRERLYSLPYTCKPSTAFEAAKSASLKHESFFLTSTITVRPHDSSVASGISLTLLQGQPSASTPTSPTCKLKDAQDQSNSDYIGVSPAFCDLQVRRCRSNEAVS
jgi:hypothetical protein